MNGSPYPLTRQMQGRNMPRPCAFYFSYVRVFILSLVAQAVKCHAESTNTCASSCACPSTHARNRGCRRKASSSGLLASNLFAAALGNARAGRNELTDDHVFLQANEMVGLRFDCCLGQHARRLL